MMQKLRNALFDVHAQNHAEAILHGDFDGILEGLVSVLLSFALTPREIVQSGGGQATSTMRLRDALYARGWHKHEFVVQTIVDGQEREATSHEVDHVLRADNGVLALEIEWNNKDPFFDRDLENFQRLHAQGAISVGILITRGASLQNAMRGIVAREIRTAGIKDLDHLENWGLKERTARQRTMLNSLLDKGIDFSDAFAQSFVADKFGAATTHWAKLETRIRRGVGNPCPLLLIGLPAACVEGYSAATSEVPEL